MAENMLFESSPTGAAYELVRALKELAAGAFEAAKAKGLLAGLSFNDIK